MTKRIKFGESSQITEVEEKLVQEEFENNLSELEEGLKYIASFVATAVGTIDALAIDQDKRPVIIEFKAPGVDVNKALMQALNYYAWCSEPTNFVWLNKYIRHINKDALKSEDELQNNIRIIIVARDFEKRLKKAVYGIQPDTMLVSYKLEQELWLLPSIEEDTGQARRKELLSPKNEDSHFKDKQDKKPLLYMETEKTS